MRAAVCRGFGQPLTVEEVTLAAPGPFQVAVRILACAICHSDIAYADGAWGGALPAVYGHEAAGQVTAVGPGVRGFAPGDFVLVTLIRACGHCPACAGGAPTSCAHAWDAGESPLRDAAGRVLAQGMNTGAFAEAVVVDASQCVPLPADLPADLACLLACGVITGVGAVVNAGRLAPGASVAVVGAGGVGLNAVQGAAIAGAGRIVAVDPLPGKLAAAAEFGATDGVLADEGTGEAIRRLTGGRGVDLAVVTVGAPSAIGAAAGYLAAGGTLVVVGMPATGTVVGYDPTGLAALNQTITGARMGRAVLARDIPWLIGHWRAGRLKLAELVSGRWRLEEINPAIAASRSGAARRNVVVFG
ncbi:alcohol dehydrogenase catalytic domain-containing protein [Amaricoccus sp.]|uniref:alcohol dehydrogenase catalytic domain-containing protein n=1 Tax=Amaricoccus sp. TaxID=1872485 RepID=UPI002D1FAFB2|nr:alcohol dehydrogenase catalytic domain-containing protein [Amaricoccus sp.]